MIAVTESAYLDRGPDAELRRYRAVRRLLETHDPRGLTRALDLAQNAIEVYRAAPTELAQPLSALLGHPDTAVRRRAAELLAVSEDGARASAGQLALLLDHHDAVLVDAAASGLARLGDERILPHLISVLEDPDGPPTWIGDALSALPQHSDLLLPMVSSAIHRHVSGCISEPCTARNYRALLIGIADWGAPARTLIDELSASATAECGVFRLANEMALRSQSEPAHLATVFECLSGRYYRKRMRLGLLEARGDHGIAAIEAHVDYALAAGRGPVTRRRSLVIDLAVIAAGGAMRPDHRALLAQLLDSPILAPHAAYALWLLDGPSAAERACSTLSERVADPYCGPIALGYLAEMGPAAMGALGAIDTVPAGRHRLIVHDPDWRYELRSDERLCAAARSARRSITCSPTG